jgi:hypothetical protein
MCHGIHNKVYPAIATEKPPKVVLFTGFFVYLIENMA